MHDISSGNVYGQQIFSLHKYFSRNIHGLFRVLSHPSQQVNASFISFTANIQTANHKGTLSFRVQPMQYIP